MRSSYIGQAWLVLVLAISFGAALAGVELGLKRRIADNKRRFTIRKVPDVVPGADAKASDMDPIQVTVGAGKDETQYDVFRALDHEGGQIGWVVKAAGKGFADKIELLIGLDARAETITGVSILDHKETPGLGNKIEQIGDKSNKGFLWQFRYHHPRADRPLAITTASPKKDEPGEANRIKAVTGATISSKSVCNIINEALSAELRGKLVAALGATTRPATTRTGPPEE
ncbi:MAG: FMN-binding protein [Phycisphaerae bacterium]